MMAIRWAGTVVVGVTHGMAAIDVLLCCADQWLAFRTFFMQSRPSLLLALLYKSGV